MASPNITTECTAVHVFPVETTTEYTAKVIEFDDGNTQSFYPVDVDLDTYEFVFENQTAAQIASLRAFVLALKGSYTVFYFNNTDPSATDTPCRMVGNLRVTRTSPNSWNARLTAKQHTP